MSEHPSLSDDQPLDEATDHGPAALPLLDPLATPERRRARVEELRRLISQGDYLVEADVVAEAVIAEHPSLLER